MPSTSTSTSTIPAQPDPDAAALARFLLALVAAHRGAALADRREPLTPPRDQLDNKPAQSLTLHAPDL